MNKKVFFILIGLAFFFQLQSVSASCAVPDPSDPCINIFVPVSGGGGVNITQKSLQFFINVKPEFGLPPLIAPSCETCYLEVQDCNGSLIQCNDGSPLTPDWNGIATKTNFEQDLNCNNQCRRYDYVSTTFNARVATVTTGSRWFRACWIDTEIFFNTTCSYNQVRIHTYDDPTTPSGSTDCLPSVSGNTSIVRRNSTLNTPCVYSNRRQTTTQTPMVLFVDGDLNLVQSDIIFDGSEIDFNSLIGTTPGTHRILMDANSSIRFYRTTNKAFTDHNNVLFDRNLLNIFGYSHD